MTSPVVAAVLAVERGEIDRAEAVRRVAPGDVEDLLHAQMTDGPSAPVAAHGVAASPGAASGRVCLSVDAVLDADDEGISAVYVRPFTTPADEVAMSAAAAIVTAKGGMASHAAVIARGWGIPAVVGVEALSVDDTAGVARLGDVVLRDGDAITVDGSAGTIMLGAAEVGEVDIPDELFTLLGWADDLRGARLAVRANADDATTARLARQFGATGVGLCRTEHMFLGDRLPLVQRAITDGGPEALDALAEAQVDDLVALLEAMDGLPVTVRLLDPPLHEFLPDHPELSEENPMLGVRGVRLGVLRPELYRAQAKAVGEAVARRLAAGGDPQAQIMVPLVVSGPELAHVRAAVVDELAGVKSRLEGRGIPVGAMIETPSLRAGRGRDRRQCRLLVRGHQRPHPDDLRVLSRRHRSQNHAPLHRPQPVGGQPIRNPGRGRSGSAGDRCGDRGPHRPPRHRDRGVRRAWWRPGIDRLLGRRRG